MSNNCYKGFNMGCDLEQPKFSNKPKSCGPQQTAGAFIIIGDCIV